MRKFILGGFILMLLIAPTIAQTSEHSWWQEVVWYEVFVRSFYDSDGDGVGDIRGVIEQLDYLNDGDPNTTDDLGITGIWLMPIMESDSYHGYDTTDYRQIEQDYGTNEDFIELMDEAHARGIHIVVDLVLNHTSDVHPWFIASRNGDEQYRDWYVWEDENPRDTGPWGQNVWYRSGDAFYYAVFWSRMPDLNHDNPEVTAEINDIARFWIEDMNVDGFRLDAIRYLVETEVNDRAVLADAPVNREYMRDFTDYVHSVNPEAMLVGEVLASTSVITRYSDDDATDMLFEFSTGENIIAAAVRGNKRDIERQLATNLYEYEPDEFATLTTNHDMDRLLSVLNGDVVKNKIAANLLLTLPGTPFIYYGEEIGMTGGKPDEFIRRPFHWDDTAVTGGFTTGTPWQPLEDNFAERTVAGQTDDPDSLLSHYRNLIHLRNAHPALQYGETIPLESSYRAAWGYIRYTDDEILLVLLNLDDDETRPFNFTIEDSPFTEFSSAELVFSTTEIDITLPELDENGGFSEWVPLEAPLPPASIYVFRLQ